MKVSVFLGSPRKKGNTAKLVDLVRLYLIEKDHQVEIIHLAPLAIAGCQECFACQKVKDRPGCSQKDDMEGIYEKMLGSDLILLARPIFCWSYPAQIKPLLDRTYCLEKYSPDGTYVSLVENKKCALVVTAAGDEFEGADLVVEGYRRMVDFHRMKNLGHLVVANFDSPMVLECRLIKKRIDTFCENLK